MSEKRSDHAEARVVPLADVARALEGRRRPGHTLLVGIDGYGGSGKSTLARALAAALDGQVVEGDDFYRPSKERQAPGFRADEVGADFDWPRLRDQVLAPLRDNRPTRFQRHDWDNDRPGEWRQLSAGGPVVVEGIYSTRPELRPLYDVVIWVEAPAEVRLARGLARDGEEARSQWVDEWMPAEDRYVAAHDPASSADLVVDGSGGQAHDPAAAVVLDQDRLGVFDGVVR
jgi:uridine kinase